MCDISAPCGQFRGLWTMLQAPRALNGRYVTLLFNGARDHVGTHHAVDFSVKRIYRNAYQVCVSKLQGRLVQPL